LRRLKLRAARATDRAIPHRTSVTNVASWSAGTVKVVGRIVKRGARILTNISAMTAQVIVPIERLKRAINGLPTEISAPAGSFSSDGVWGWSIIEQSRAAL
jgi:hypothetical protein